MKTIFQSFFECVRLQGFKVQDQSQTDEEYIRAFCWAIAKIPADMYNLLPSAAHTWYSNTARYINNKREYETWPKCEGFVSIHPAPPPPRLFPPPQKKKRVGPKYSKFKGVIQEIQKMVMLHPDWPARTIHKYLDAAGFSGLSFDVVSVTCSEVRAMMYLAQELGFWRPVSIYEKEIPLDPTEVPKEKQQI
jgi:hypothetical protein